MPRIERRVHALCVYSTRKNGGALAVEAEKEASLDLLFQRIEFRRGEELTEGNVKTITKLLNRHDARIFTFIIKDTLDGCLRNGRQIC